jgi:hypothetical protein
MHRRLSKDAFWSFLIASAANLVFLLKRYRFLDIGIEYEEV